MPWKLRPSLKPLASVVFGDLEHIFGLLMLIGVVGGLTGAAFLFLMHWLERFLGPEAHGPWMHVAMMGGVGVAVALLTRFLGSPGSVELLVDNIHVLGGRKDIRDLRSLLPISLLCIAAGGAAGPEAPLVQTTGSIGSYLAERRKLSLSDKRVLTIAGMAAGFTVLFGTPLGAAIFALEILHRKGMEYYEALLPAVLGSLCGYAVYVALTGLDLAPIWTFPALGHLRAIDLLWALAAGVAGAAVAVVFTYLNLWMHKAFSFLPGFARPIVGGLALGLLALSSRYVLTFGDWSKYALTFGEDQIGAIAGEHLALGVLILAVGAKLVGTGLTVSSGWRGGFIIPLFFVGAVLGRYWHGLLPQHTNEVVLMAALMAAVNTGVTKTPLGSTIVVSEMAGLKLLPTTLIAAVVALLLTSEVGLIESQRSRTQVEVNGGGAGRHKE